MTTIEAAKILKCTPRRVRQFIEGGRLAARKTGRDYDVDAEALRKFKRLPRQSGAPKKNGAARQN